MTPDVVSNRYSKQEDIENDANFVAEVYATAVLFPVAHEDSFKEYLYNNVDADPDRIDDAWGSAENYNWDKSSDLFLRTKQKVEWNLKYEDSRSLEGYSEKGFGDNVLKILNGEEF